MPSTLHIFGGACIGENDQVGVIDKYKIFNYENMYIFYGTKISTGPEVNSSLSIISITEYGMSKTHDKLSDKLPQQTRKI